jgi:hypothetical protein
MRKKTLGLLICCHNIAACHRGREAAGAQEMCGLHWGQHHVTQASFTGGTPGLGETDDDESRSHVTSTSSPTAAAAAARHNQRCSHGVCVMLLRV